MRVKKRSLNIVNDEGTNVHVAIVDGETATLIIDGKKTIETRFNQNRIAPYGKIESGDTILIKKTGGPVIGIAKAGEVRFYCNLDENKIEKLRREFNDRILAESDFWSSKKHSRYATFIYLENIKPTDPFVLKKRNRSGWRILKET